MNRKLLAKYDDMSGEVRSDVAGGTNMTYSQLTIEQLSQIDTPEAREMEGLLRMLLNRHE